MKTLAFSSGVKGGTGKTTLAVNIAVALAYAYRNKSKYPVVLIDLTPSPGTASMLLMGSREVKGMNLSDYLDGRLIDPLQAFYLRRWQIQSDEFNVVFSFMTRPAPFFRKPFEALTKQLEQRLGSMLLIIDSPPLGRGSPLQGLFDYVVPVTVPDISSVAAAAEVSAELGGRRLKPILNMYMKEAKVSGIYGGDWPDIVRDAFGEEPHVVPYDPLLGLARQALEIEVLKLRPEESPGVSSLLSYARYLLTQLSI
ncbi:ParA family protein [Thermoproteus tenax]|uniref:ATPase involved in chromosome partition n=1 Tax=Thermoproteus tenax (strain ATCC 35583 / DSM 2078 / JCM 9277 / NBRC 100435 / Kra 1) TaxID=768679 RepID=G4RP28_THETK|nr:ParA family protein [Thermoproteus tenax]CCC81322.1 ATPase involved in chromosome partition [Thermoproteus tenax Kra 1]